MCSNSDLQSRTKGTVWLITEMFFLFLWEPWTEKSVMALIQTGLHSLWLTFISRNEYRFLESIQPLTILIAEPQKDSSKNMRWNFFLFIPLVLQLFGGNIIYLRIPSWSTIKNKLAFPGGSSGEESACQCGRDMLDPWSGKNPHVVEQLSPCAAITEPVL